MVRTFGMLSAADERRGIGLVFQDDAVSEKPAAHVLVIGVGIYQSLKLGTQLKTAALSARRIADWFLGAGNKGYANPARPLASLAVVLSESADENERAELAGGPVPRATLNNTRDAVKEWLKRIDTHRDNLAILYITAHGESANGRTAFMLEDYGLDPYDISMGLVQVEQFVGALENAKPIYQLLVVDCCRSPSEDILPADDQIGSKLISLARKADDHGEPRKQWLVCSTSLREYAYGRLDGPTFFNTCLMEAMLGAASDVASNGWPVRPGALFDRLDQLLALYRLPNEKQQTPAGRMSGTFDINHPGEQVEVAVYICLEKPEDWDSCIIEVTVERQLLKTHEGIAAEPAFIRLDLKEGELVEVVVRKDGRIFGKRQERVRPPICFVKVADMRQPSVAGVATMGAMAAPHRVITAIDLALPKADKGTQQTSKVDTADMPCAGTNSSGTEGIPDITLEPDQIPLQIDEETRMPSLEVVVKSDLPMVNGAAYVVRDARGGEVTQGTLDVGALSAGHSAVMLAAPGFYEVTLHTPDGRVQKAGVDLAPGQTSLIEFNQAPSPHEWMRAAIRSTGIDTTPLADGSRLWEKVTQGVPKSWVKLQSILQLPSQAAAVSATVVGQYQFDDTLTPPTGTLDVRVENQDDRYVRIDVDDHTPSRYLMDDSSVPSEILLANRSLWTPPVFARVAASDGRVEFAVIPSLGNRGQETPGGWRPHLVVDKRVGSSDLMTTVVVEDCRWAGLLGFLGVRNFEAGAALLRCGIQDLAKNSLADKESNPLAAIAGALLLIGAADPKTQQFWDSWLTNLCKWFTDIPDGAILLGRRKLLSAQNAEDLVEARKWLLEGYRRGVPFYALSVDWLARGLESLQGTEPDAELDLACVNARLIANRVDPLRTFTVLREKRKELLA